MNQPDRPHHWPSFWQFAFSALAAINLWMAALGALLMGLLAMLGEQFGPSGMPGSQPLALLLVASGLFALGLLVLPSAAYALGRLSGWHLPDSQAWLRRLRPALWMLFVPPVIGLGFWLAGSPINWLLLPLLHILAVLLSVGWLAWIGMHGLPVGSDQRFWGVLACGLALGPLVIMILESLAGGAYLVIGLLALAGEPQLVDMLSQTLMELQTDPTAINRTELLPAVQTLLTHLLRPGVIFAAFSLISVVVPLIEELFKPIAVWLLANRRLSPAQGFAIGCLSGAGYALFESMLLGANADQWATLVSARLGTSAMHILTAGMTGWGLAQAWKTGRYALLGLVYLAAVTVHGAWNALALGVGLASLPRAVGRPGALPQVSQLAEIAPAALAVLAILILFALFAANRWLAKQERSFP